MTSDCESPEEKKIRKAMAKKYPTISPKDRARMVGKVDSFLCLTPAEVAAALGTSSRYFFRWMDDTCKAALTLDQRVRLYHLVEVAERWPFKEPFNWSKNVCEEASAAMTMWNSAKTNMLSKEFSATLVKASVNSLVKELSSIRRSML